MERDHFEPIWRSVGAQDVTAFEPLRRCWSEAHRHYHTLEHLDECLAWHHAVGGSEEVALALYFHDAVYDPSRTDNEAESAALFARLAGRDGVRSEVIGRVSALILSTATHDGEGEAALLSDIDLAILGAPPARYDRFERDVRREYAMFDDARYRAGRRKVLRSFLERLAIYETPAFQHLEAQARNNLARALTPDPFG